MKKRLEKARGSNMGGERDRGFNMGEERQRVGYLSSEGRISSIHIRLQCTPISA